MADYKFNTPTGETVARELLVLYLNTGSADSPVWSPVGRRVEDSSIELDWSTESKTDIFGDTYTTGKKATRTQSFEPCELDSGDAAQQKIWNLAIKDNNVNALLNMDLLLVHLYAGNNPTAVYAERYPSSSVLPTGLGGEGGGSVGMPIDVTFGGTRVEGTAAVSGGAVTFTPEPVTASYTSDMTV